MHALLFRKWKNRVKGRDWYDLEWYIRNGVPLNVDHFLARARDTGDWKGDSISEKQILNLLNAKIDSVSFKQIKEDVVRFVKDAGALDIWGAEYFRDLTEKLLFEKMSDQTRQ